MTDVKAATSVFYTQSMLLLSTDTLPLTPLLSKIKSTSTPLTFRFLRLNSLLSDQDLRLVVGRLVVSILSPLMVGQ